MNEISLMLHCILSWRQHSVSTVFTQFKLQYQELVLAQIAIFTCKNVLLGEMKKMLVEYNELPLSSKTKLCFLSQSTCDRLHFSTNYC